MTRGLHNAIIDYTDAVEDLMKLFEAIPHPLSNSSIRSALQDPDYLDAKTMDLKYFHNGLVDASTKYFAHPIKTKVDNAQNFILAATISYCLIIVGLQFLLFRPSVRDLGEDVKRSSVMVFMINSDILDNIESFKQYSQNAGMRKSKK